MTRLLLRMPSTKPLGCTWVPRFACGRKGLGVPCRLGEPSEPALGHSGTRHSESRAGVLASLETSSRGGEWHPCDGRFCHPLCLFFTCGRFRAIAKVLPFYLLGGWTMVPTVGQLLWNGGAKRTKLDAFSLDLPIGLVFVSSRLVASEWSRIVSASYLRILVFKKFHFEHGRHHSIL